MADSPTLADLRVEWTYPQGAGEHGQYEGTRSRPATREDIIAVVREMGGEVREFENFEYYAFKSGRYLIIPLEES